MDLSNPENNWIIFIGAVVIMTGLIVAPIIITKLMKKE